MSGRPIVFSVAALDALLEGIAGLEADRSIFTVAPHVQERVTRVEVNGVSFFVHASDGADARRIVLPSAATAETLEADRAVAETSLQRAHQMALQAERLPLRLNPGWSPYRHNNLAAFFALPRSMGALRWLAEVNPRGSRDVVFWELTSPSKPLKLERFRPPLERRAREHGVQIITGERVDALPDPPVIVALELRDARTLLKDDVLHWPSGHTVCLDLALRDRRGDPWIVSDLENAGWIERFSAQDPSLAPAGEALVQGQMPIRPDETPEDAAIRLEALLDASFEDWRQRTTWRRRQAMDGRSGALDLPGSTWRDRPAVDRGDGILLCGDQVAATGCLSEVSFASAVQAGRLALEQARRRTVPQAAYAPTSRDRSGDGRAGGRFVTTAGLSP